MAMLARAGGDRRRPADPGRRRQDHQVPARRRSPTRRLLHRTRSNGTAWVGLIIGALIARGRHLDRLPRSRSRKPGTSRAAAGSGCARAAHLPLQQVVLRRADRRRSSCAPPHGLGRFAGTTVLESGVIAGGVTGGATGVVRARCRRSVRRGQTGFLRYYAAAMIVGICGVALYFLIAGDMTLSILIWLPLAVALLGAVAARAAGRRALARARLAGHARRSRSRSSRASTAAVRACSSSPTRCGSRARASTTSSASTGSTCCWCCSPRSCSARALIWAPTREWERPRIFYFHFVLAESRRARRVLRPGPGAVRRLLRPDADPVLLPVGDLGRARTGSRATTKLVIYTLVGSFFMLVGGDRHRRARLQPARHRRSTFALQRAAGACRCRTARRSGSSCASRSRSWSRCRSSRSTAGCPTGTRRCRSRRSPCSPAILSKVAAYGFLRIVLPLFPYAAVHFQMLMLIIALVSILWGTRGGDDHSPTPGWSSPTRRSPSSASSCSGSSR